MKNKLLNWLLRLGVFIGLAMVAWGLWTPVQPPAAPAARADMIVVLGGESVDRINEAIRLYEGGHAPKILVTGDDGLIVAALFARGIPSEAVVHENAATSTVENARFTKPIMEKAGVKSAIIVTSWYHAGRALKIFEHEVPGITCSLAYVSKEASLGKENNAHMARREKFAIIHTLLWYRVPCLW